MQKFQVGRQPIPSTEKDLSLIFRLVLNTTKSQLLDERSDVKECQRRVSTSWQCNQTHGRRLAGPLSDDWLTLYV